MDDGGALDAWLGRPARHGSRNAVALIGAPGYADVTQALSAVRSALRDGDGAWLDESTDGASSEVQATIVVVLAGVQDLASAAEVAERLLDALPGLDARAGVTLVGPGEGSRSARRRAEGALLLAWEPGPRVVTSPPLPPRP